MPEIRWSGKATLGFVLASKGYPGSYGKGYAISGLDEAMSLGDVRIYHMGTAMKDGGYVTSGGRVLMVVGSGDDLKSARDLALRAAECIRCDKFFYRKDIGWRFKTGWRRSALGRPGRVYAPAVLSLPDERAA